MLLSFRNLVLSSAALCATAACAAEQKRVEVPFSFVASHHVYQAGSYTVAMDKARSTITLSEIGNKSQTLVWLIRPVADDSQPRISLTFDVNGSDHVLRTIQWGAFTTPNMDARPRHGVESTATIGE
jgi:hypothetical protein